MQLQIISFLQSLSLGNYWWIIMIFGGFISVFYLWRDIKIRKGNEYYRQEHVFDFVLFSTIIGILLARILFIMMNRNLYSDVRWFWIPYEKIENQILWFESFPWQFFKMNLENTMIEGFYLGLWSGINIVRRIHHLKWKKISMAISNYVGLLTAFGSWIGYLLSGKEFLLYPTLILFILFLTKELTSSSFDIFRKLTSALWKFSSVFVLPTVIIYDRLVINYCCVISLDLFWILAVAILTIIIFISMNYVKKKQPDKFQHLKTQRARIPTKIQKRSYTLSYRTLSGKWWQKLISRIRSDEKDTSNNK